MTNTKPDSEGYLELSDDMMGKPLVKEGDTVRVMSEEEHEALLLTERINMSKNIATDKAAVLLKKSEILVLPDAWEAYTKEQKAVVTDYRNFLKNIEKQAGYPLELVWPELPVIGA